MTRRAKATQAVLSERLSDGKEVGKVS